LYFFLSFFPFFTESRKKVSPRGTTWYPVALRAILTNGKSENEVATSF
jgi:hypothetical protein